MHGCDCYSMSTAWVRLHVDMHRANATPPDVVTDSVDRIPCRLATTRQPPMQAMRCV